MSPLLRHTAFALTLLTAGLGAHAAGTVEVQFKPADQYTDGGRNNVESERTLQRLGDHFKSLAARLPDGQVLKLDVVDLDLAGQLKPARMGEELRVVRGGADWPAMELRWTLSANGQTLASHDDRLRDMDYLSQSRIGNSDPLFYEKRMIDRWFDRRFGAEAVAARH